MSTLYLTAFAAVFFAEIAGDKLLYTTGILSTRFDMIPVIAGMAAAFAVKMGAAVVLGMAIARLPKVVIISLTSVSFLATAVAMWVRSNSKSVARKDHDAGRATLVSFSAILFSEWGDLGQITAAALTARYGSPVAIWLGAVTALVLKGSLAAFLGAGARRWLAQHVSPRAARNGGVGLLLVLGLLSVAESMGALR
jgi:putative Ca2+/H+ antiporter (TMEM165/GDT1 family)